jgi:polyisoprenoid-binding protein YceI
MLLALQSFSSVYPSGLKQMQWLGLHFFIYQRISEQSMNTFVKKTAYILFAGAVACTSVTALAAPKTYEVDADHTFARFGYSHFGLSTQISRFNSTSGTVVFDQEAKTGQVNIVIDTTSVDTGSALFDEHIQAADFLDTTRFPTAAFTSSNVVFEGDRPVAVKGDLTIKGITKPVTLTITNFVSAAHPMMEGKDVIGADAEVTIKRSDFNAGMYAPHVGDNVTLSIALEAITK